MKRTNVVLDEELLEQARLVTGERTYSGAINAALREIVRQYNFEKALDAFEREAAKGDFFWPGYLEEIRPNAYSVQTKKRPAAHEQRLAPAKSRGRRTR